MAGIHKRLESEHEMWWGALARGVNEALKTWEARLRERRGQSSTWKNRCPRVISCVLFHPWLTLSE
jgi:hypothetical protein